MKQIVSLSFVVLLMLSLTATGYSQTAGGSVEGKAVSLKLGHNSHVESFTGKALYKLGQAGFRSNGWKAEDRYLPPEPVGQQQGALGANGFGILGYECSRDERLGGLQESKKGIWPKFPFLFRSTEHAYRWWTSPEGMAIIKKAELRGVKILGIGLNRMPRQFASKSKAIRVPEDIRNLKVRAGDTATNSALKILGAVPTNVALNEMYTAVSQGMVDVIELPLDYIYDYSIFEVTKYLTLINHTFDVQWVVSMRKNSNPCRRLTRSFCWIRCPIWQKTTTQGKRRISRTFCRNSKTRA